MVKHYFVLLIFITFFSNLVIAQENLGIIDNKNNEFIESDGNTDTDKLLIGTMISFTGFNGFRIGAGLFLGKLGSDGHHPVGYDYGILFEYFFREKIIYTRLYGHLTGGVSAILLGGSIVMAIDSNNISVGLAPEIGIGLSALFKIFYRYNFYLNKDFNSYEVAFHLCIPLSKKN
ncbi:MAG: hypothetical protein LBB81_06470 [Treponema sp.]|jgi:hypothetical protein|nr:hypothetical protein [Treponema sp.]